MERPPALDLSIRLSPQPAEAGFTAVRPPGAVSTAGRAGDESRINRKRPSTTGSAAPSEGGDPMPRIVKFFETTLRDGEQTPGINYFAEEKLEIARALADMGFDTLDCGFAISGEPEFEAIRLVARNVHNAEICSIARSFPDDRSE